MNESARSPLGLSEAGRTALVLAFSVQAARQELREHGEVGALTWRVLDNLLARMIDELPVPRVRR